MPDPTPPTEAERLEADMEAFKQRQAWFYNHAPECQQARRHSFGYQAAVAFKLAMDERLAAVRNEERERCARIVEDFNFPSTGTLLGDVEEAYKRSPDDWLNAAAAALREGAP